MEVDRVVETFAATVAASHPLEPLCPVVDAFRQRVGHIRSRYVDDILPVAFYHSRHLPRKEKQSSQAILLINFFTQQVLLAGGKQFAFDDGAIGGVNFVADITPAERFRHFQRRAAAGKRVQHQIIDKRKESDAAVNDFLRHNGRMFAERKVALSGNGNVPYLPGEVHLFFLRQPACPFDFR